MNSVSPSETCIAQAAEFARPILRHLRRLVQEACPEAEEAVKWGQLSFVYRGKILCGMGAFKSHCTFGFWHQGMTRLLTQELGKTEEAMGLMGRITCLADLPNDATMRRYIRRAAELIESGTPSRVPVKPKAVPPVLADLRATLKKSKLAAATFASFSPSHRREYIEWITEAKRAETRQKRLATTLAWLTEGKPRNWKYMNG
ncbi:MAG: YdeI/OmpD-associated family protein [Verrucomicrobiota bacterium]